MPLLILRVFITLAVGLLGAFCAKKLRVLAPYTTGSMLAVLLFGILTQKAYLPTGIKPVIQAVAGGAIGVSISRDSLRGMKSILAPLALYAAAVILLPLSAAMLATACTPLDAVTALLGCAPGGISDMTLLSYDYGANASHVAMMHMLRMIFALGIFPSITGWFIKRSSHSYDTPANESAAPVVRAPRGSREAAITAAVFLSCGAAGYFAGIPAGVLSFSMIGASAFQIKTQCAYVPPYLKRAAQIVAGALVGAGATLDDLKALLTLLPAVLILLVEYLLLNFAVGPLITRIFHINLATTLLACAPAGITEMALIAEDLGGDQGKVAIFQVTRMALVLLIFPLMAQLLSP